MWQLGGAVSGVVPDCFNRDGFTTPASTTPLPSPCDVLLESDVMIVGGMLRGIKKSDTIKESPEACMATCVGYKECLAFNWFSQRGLCSLLGSINTNLGKNGRKSLPGHFGGSVSGVVPDCFREGFTTT